MAASDDNLIVMPFGACLLHGPINAATKAGGLRCARVGRNGTIPGAYTLAETLQLLAFLRGEVGMPKDIRPVCDYDPDFEPLTTSAPLGDTNVVLVEPNAPYEIKLGDYRLNRAAILTHVTNPLKVNNRDAAKTANMWFNKGLMSQNDDIRSSCGEKLISLIPPGMANADMVRDVLRHATGHRTSTIEGLKSLRERISQPIGVVTYMFQYMPDGRPVSWPANFHQEVLDAARELGLPVFEPWRLVEKAGPVAALKPDLRHYTDTFMPVMADAIARFAEVVANNRTAVLTS
jgi:hypothetical protein